MALANVGGIFGSGKPPVVTATKTAQPTLAVKAAAAAAIANLSANAAGAAAASPPPLPQWYLDSCAAGAAGSTKPASPPPFPKWYVDSCAAAASGAARPASPPPLPQWYIDSCKAQAAAIAALNPPPLPPEYYAAEAARQPPPLPPQPKLLDTPPFGHPLFSPPPVVGPDGTIFTSPDPSHLPGFVKKTTKPDGAGNKIQKRAAGKAVNTVILSPDGARSDIRFIRRNGLLPDQQGEIRIIRQKANADGTFYQRERVWLVHKEAHPTKGTNGYFPKAGDNFIRLEKPLMGEYIALHKLYQQEYPDFDDFLRNNLPPERENATKEQHLAHIAKLKAAAAEDELAGGLPASSAVTPPPVTRSLSDGRTPSPPVPSAATPTSAAVGHKRKR